MLLEEGVERESLPVVGTRMKILGIAYMEIQIRRERGFAFGAQRVEYLIGFRKEFGISQ